MNVISKISVDLTRPNMGTRVNAVQGDGNTRSVDITLLADGQPWKPPEGVEAAIAYRQPGGTKGLYNQLADGTPAISISGNVATITLAPQMLTVPGTVQASIVFNDAQLNQLTTFPFSVSVAQNQYAGAQKVEDYIRLQWLEDKLDEYLRKAADSGAFDGNDGLTAYQVAVANGFVGTQAEWLASLHGKDGDSTEATAAALADETAATNAEQHAAAAQKSAESVVTDVNRIKADKLDKPAAPPAAAGKILRVLAVHEDGTFTCEWADAPSGCVTDIAINGKSIVEDGAVDIKANTTNGIGFNNSGFYVSGATPANIDLRANGNRAIVPTTYDYAVKAAMCDGIGAAWTDTERIAALLRMGCTVDDSGSVHWTAQEVSE